MSEQTLKVEIDASAAADQIGQALQAGGSYELESAISRTVELLKGIDDKRLEIHQVSGNVERIDSGQDNFLFERLSEHLDFLLAEQRAMVSSWRDLPGQGADHGAP